MTADQPRFAPILNVLLVVGDPVFRSALRLWLETTAQVRVVAESGDGEAALGQLALRIGSDDEDIPPDPLNLAIVDLQLGQANPTAVQGLDLCQRIRVTYPDLSVLMIGTVDEPVLLAAVRQAGASGFCSRTAPLETLAIAIRRTAMGQTFWSPPPAAPTVALTPAPTPVGPLAYARRNLRQSGMQRIDQTIEEIVSYLRSPNLSLLDRAVLAGRYRELKASRWLVSRLLATPALEEAIESQSETVPPQAATQSRINPGGTAETTRIAASGGVATPDRSALATVGSPSDLVNAQTAVRNLRSALFDELLSRLQSNLENLTDTPMETDILRSDRKRDLFYLILRKLEDLLDELRFSQVQPGQLGEKRSQLLLDLWEASTTDFFGKYYTIAYRDLEVGVVSTLLQDAPTVESEILDKIPGFVDVVAHLLFQSPLLIDSVPAAVGSPEAMIRAEILLGNTIIQVANAVVQPLLNRFADVEAIKQNFYDRRLLSSREIERFRNDLSWCYRINRLFREPQNIFESKYRLWMFYESGIKTADIYAPRRDELEQLSGFQYAVTLALETRDAIAPRIRSAVAFVGSGVIYVLTEVIGRGIGLIGRGVLKGIGNTWRDELGGRRGK
jgi:DNA-binding NarL/FixJ family response regulator